LVFQAFWLNVVVPGHQRGIVQLPGAVAAASRYRAPCLSCGCDAAPKSSKSDSPASRSGTCAICFFAAHLSIPPTVDLSLARLNFLHRLRPMVEEDRIARIVVTPFDSRGPPVAA